MQIENSICDYDAVEKINDEMRVQLNDIVQQKFFRYYKVKKIFAETCCPPARERHYVPNAEHRLFPFFLSFVFNS